MAHHMTTHGLSNTVEYHAWEDMCSRCGNPNSISYKNYGARGIAVCERWRKNFAAFFDDLGPKPDPSLTLERIDNDQGYEPGNCRWASRAENLANRRLYHGGVTVDGLTTSLKDAMSRYGVKDRALLRYRVARGMSLENAIKLGPRLAGQAYRYAER